MKKLDKPAAQQQQASQPAANPNAVQFIFVPETRETRGLGWHTSITGVIGIALKPRETKLKSVAITGGRVIVDDVDLDAVMQEAKTNTLNTPMAKSRADLKAQWITAQQAHGLRVSEFTAQAAAAKKAAGVAKEEQALEPPAGNTGTGTTADGGEEQQQ